MVRKILLATLVASALTVGAPLVNAESIVRIAPPPPRQEAAPAHRRGHVWAPGHWVWRNNNYKWVRGTWVRERRGYNYNPPTWIERDGRWHMDRGGWRRGDRDRDGVPNRMDRAPNNPNRN